MSTARKIRNWRRSLLPEMQIKKWEGLRKRESSVTDALRGWANSACEEYVLAQGLKMAKEERKTKRVLRSGRSRPDQEFVRGNIRLGGEEKTEKEGGGGANQARNRHRSKIDVGRKQINVRQPGSRKLEGKHPQGRGVMRYDPTNDYASNLAKRSSLIRLKKSN